MPVQFVSSLIFNYLPSHYYVRILLVVFAIAVIRAYCQGRVTNRERDLHGRVILLTGGFTPIGLTLLENLARRGAHIIALSPDPIDSPQVLLVIDALRTLSSNEHVHADHCDLNSATSVRSFCNQFLTGSEHRLDAIIFAHEYEHIGAMWGTAHVRDSQKRIDASMSTFLITTLLLPVLLVAPPERDIRIISLINPFYAAAIPTFSPSSSPTVQSVFLREGYRSLKTAIFARHLQRVLDALPSAPAPNPDSNSPPLAGSKEQKSNIVAVSVSPGFSRADTIASMLRANRSSPDFSFIGVILHILLQPFSRIFARSSYYAVQTILHALFLPTPFKRALADNAPVEGDEEEILKPGALYSNCAVVRLNIPVRSLPTAKDPKDKKPEVVKVPHDDEMGGEEMGRLVWESFEEKLKIWENDSAENKPSDPPVSTHVKQD
ncbi:hypothetical protein BD410DRAFT_787735 [Rickenella mellea]|uniref:Ketoreductase (KR) domain-containing protein n=1 Tax=Rickenella mellea TaxID=50990 RepID=A0A4Y7Q5I9_9AGAM|nr:hypothetical protein BD410DRAFT_787735 [Rickenella mellea]